MQNPTNKNNHVEKPRVKPRAGLCASKLGVILGYKSNDNLHANARKKLSESMLKKLIDKLYPNKYSNDFLKFDLLNKSKNSNLPDYFQDRAPESKKIGIHAVRYKETIHNKSDLEINTGTFLNNKGQFSTLQVNSLDNVKPSQSDTDSEICESAKRLNILNILDSDKFHAKKDRHKDFSMQKKPTDKTIKISSSSSKFGVLNLPQINNMRKMKIKYDILRKSNKTQNHQDNLSIMKKYYNNPNQLPDNSKYKFICRRGSLSINKSVDILEALSKMDRKRFILLKAFNLN